MSWQSSPSSFFLFSMRDTNLFTFDYLLNFVLMCVCVCHWKAFVVQMCLMCCVLGGRRVFAATAAAVKVHPKLDIIVFTCVQLRAGLSPTLSSLSRDRALSVCVLTPLTYGPAFVKLNYFSICMRHFFCSRFQKTFLSSPTIITIKLTPDWHSTPLL